MNSNRIICLSFHVVSLMCLLSEIAQASSPFSSLNRKLEFVNVCAAYDVLADIIDNGYEKCVCGSDGRSIECGFNGECSDATTPPTCGNVTMVLDYYTQAGDESVTYLIAFQNEALEDLFIDLQVSPVEGQEGILGCRQALYGGLGSQSECECSPCDDKASLTIDCTAHIPGAKVDCQPLDVTAFPPLLPAFDLAVAIEEGEAGVDASDTAGVDNDPNAVEDSTRGELNEAGLEGSGSKRSNLVAALMFASATITIFL